MSTHVCPVVKLGEPIAIPGADKIEVFDILGNGPVVSAKGQFKASDLAVFVPPESVVDTSLEAFTFLKSKARKSDGWAKIRPVRLRGQLSIGLLMPANGMSEGEDGAKRYSVKKYEDHVKVETIHGHNSGKTPGWIIKLWRRFFPSKEDRGLWPGIPVYDINQLYKMRPGIFADDELMVVTEKLHGTNARFVIGRDGKLWCGSRTMWRNHDGKNVYSRAATESGIEAKLRRLAEPIVIWGEIVGPQIQKGFNYGLKDGEQKFYVFDMYHATERRFLDPKEVYDICHWLKMTMVSIIAIDKWSSIKEQLLSLTQAQSPGEHPQEGIVVRPYLNVKETHGLDGNLCMVAGKVINPAYLEFREKPGMDENIIL